MGKRFPFDITKTKKQSHFCNCLIWSGKREFNLCSPIILSAKIGIEENFISRLFENYFRVDTHLEDAGNSGLFSNFPNAQMPKRASKNPKLFRVNGLTFLIKFTPIPHDFSGLLLSFRVTVLTVFQVRILPYSAHLKFLCCNHLCKDNKIILTYKIKQFNHYLHTNFSYNSSKYSFGINPTSGRL